MEKYKEIKDNKGYIVSSFGRIINTKTGKTLTIDTSNSYARVNINKKRYFVHRVVLSHFKKNSLNSDIVNHKDGNKLNNHLDNLEWVNIRENASHYRLLKNNKTSRYMGVHYRKDSNKWRASIRINNKLIDLGTYKTEAEAGMAYIRYISENNIMNKYA